MHEEAAFATFAQPLLHISGTAPRVGVQHPRRVDRPPLASATANSIEHHHALFYQRTIIRGGFTPSEEIRRRWAEHSGNISLEVRFDALPPE